MLRRSQSADIRRQVVLLVQQSRDDGLDMYAEYLRYHGLAPIAVSSAKDARNLAPGADVIVTGIKLDDAVDGVELVSRLRHTDATKRKPIVVLTACAEPGDRRRAQQAGCDTFLPKPCLPNELLRQVRRLLSTTRRRKREYTDASIAR